MNRRYRGNERPNNASYKTASAPKSAKCRKLVVAENARLLDFLTTKLSGQSATSIKQLLKHRCILVGDEAVTQFDYELVPGNEVSILSAGENRFSLNHPKLRIIFEDENLIAVEKASGLHSVDSTGGGCDNAASVLENYIRRRDPSKRIYVVHRLDRDTSGVLIFAKTREAQNRLVKTWNDSVRERAYIAIIEGKLPTDKGIIDSWLYEDDRKVVHSTHDPHLGLRAITHYKVIRTNEKYSEIRLDLETGRTNQIRVHLQSLGHPIIGDEKYGSQVDPIGRLGLHALNIRFRHPMNGREVSYVSPEPREFSELMQPIIR